MIESTEGRLQYTIEARELTSEMTRNAARNAVTRRTIEARDEGDALSSFVRDQQSEVVSFQPVHGRESIATVKKDDCVFLVRVYAG